MNFIRLWMLGYIKPARMIDELQTKPAPHWGLLAQLVRSLLDAFLLYLPLSRMGLVPPMPSYLSVFPTEHYYGTLVWLAPIVLMAELLTQAAVGHAVIRLTGRRSDFDRIVNIFGMSALVVGAFLMIWDWTWIAIGGMNQYFMGFTHLAISLWAAFICVLGLKKTLGVPVWLGILIGLLTIAVGLPFGIMFMRSPL